MRRLFLVAVLACVAGLSGAVTMTWDTLQSGERASFGLITGKNFTVSAKVTWAVGKTWPPEQNAKLLTFVGLGNVNGCLDGIVAYGENTGLGLTLTKSGSTQGVGWTSVVEGMTQGEATEVRLVCEWDTGRKTWVVTFYVGGVQAQNASGTLILVGAPESLSLEANTQDGRFSFSDIRVEGEAVALPEPTVLALLVLGGAALALRRRTL